MHSSLTSPLQQLAQWHARRHINVESLSLASLVRHGGLQYPVSDYALLIGAFDALQYAFYTMLVTDHHGNALPIGFISAREDARTLGHCMGLFAAAAQRACPCWRPSCFVTDDDLAEH